MGERIRMTNDEIRGAVENLKQCIVANYKDTPVKFSTVNSADIHTLLTLAEEYLKIEGWPEVQSCNCSIYQHDYCECGYKQFNKALHLCKLAKIKEMSNMTIEDFKQIGQKLAELVSGKEA